MGQTSSAVRVPGWLWGTVSAIGLALVIGIGTQVLGHAVSISAHEARLDELDKSRVTLQNQLTRMEDKLDRVLERQTK